MFWLALVALTLLLGVEIHRSDVLHMGRPIVEEGARPRFQSNPLTPENPARCPEGSVSSPEIAPRKIADVTPVYPAAARELAVSGVVIVQILIDKGGEVAAAKVIRSVPALDEAAINAVRHWKYTPTMVNGEPVCAGVTVTVDVKP